MEPFGTSDHNQVRFDVLRSIVWHFTTFLARNFKFANWAGIKLLLHNVDFFDLFHSNLPAQSILDRFYEIINSCIDQYVPCKHIAVSESSHIKYPYKIQRLIKKKSAAWCIYRTFRTQESYSSYKSVTSKCKAAITDFVASYENNLVTNGNLGDFYRYANNKFSCKSAVGPLQDNNGLITTDPALKADIMQHAFLNNYTADNGCLPHFPKQTSELNCILFTPTLVRRVIRKLKVKTKGGPGGIPQSSILTAAMNFVTH
jgi:hypothetical protein